MDKHHLLTLFLDLLPSRAAERVLCFTTLGMELPTQVALRFPDAHFSCFFLDAFHYNAAQENSVIPPNVELVCAADLPEATYDLVLLPVSVSGEAELTRDLMQQAHERLAIGGQCIAVVDHPHDHWLKEQMEILFRRVHRSATEDAAAYTAVKHEPLRKTKDFGCEFVFRDHDRLLRAYSRPGVFSHRRVDSGARQLMAAMEISAGDRVLDIGCGSGVVALAAAARAEHVSVHAIDSSTRAVQCTWIGAARNGLDQVISAEVAIAGLWSGGETFDVALANPPYYASFRISAAFLDTAARSLRGGGLVKIVTKSPQWYAENMGDWFADVELHGAKSYYVLSGRKES